MSMMKKASDLGNKNIPKQLLVQVSPAPLQTLYFREESTNPASVTIELWKMEDGNYVIFQGNNGDGAWGTENISVFDQRPTLDSALATVRQNFACPNIPESKNPQMVASKSRLRKVVAGTQESMNFQNELEQFVSDIQELVQKGRAIKTGLDKFLGPQDSGSFEMYILNRLKSMTNDGEQFSFSKAIDELYNYSDDEE